MESLKNARGNSKDPTQDGQSSKKKSQHTITAFFRKPPSSGSQNKEEENHINGVSHEIDHQNQIQTRQQTSSQQQMRDQSQGKVQSSNQSSNQFEENNKSQTPKKKSMETPKKRVKESAQKQQNHQSTIENDGSNSNNNNLSKSNSIDEIQLLVNKKVKEQQQIIDQQSNSPANHTQQDLSQPQLSQGRILRPRKVENYKQMLEGDEVTMKTIQDEQLEIKKKKSGSQIYDDEEDEEMDDAQIERASDDEDDEDYPIKRRSKRKAKKINDDSAEENDEESSEDDDVMDDLENESFTLEEGDNKRKQKQNAKVQAKAIKKRKTESIQDHHDDEEETVFIDNLPNDEFEIRRMLKEVKKHIKALEKQFFEEEDSEKEEELKIINNNSKHDEALEAFKETSHLKQFWCIPLSVNVKNFDFDELAKSQIKQGGRLFDVITIDPPWQLSSANPTRGVAIAYDTLNDREILSMPFNKLQTDGFLFIWVINAKYRFALQMMEEFGYKLVDEIAWVKQTVNGKIAKGHGYYLQHAKETCLVGVKGNVKGKARFNIESDVIFSQRRGQSQKPEEIYEIAEALVPNGFYLEIFGRRNNLHNGWVTIGNEL